MAGDEPRDVRDTLSELERRLLDLERELRAEAAQDAASGAPGAPVAPPSGEGAEPVAAPVPAGVGESPPGAGPATPPVGALADDARARMTALRASLDGLVGASDRLRETAQTVVEDHGRALVRLDRMSAAQAATLVGAAQAEAPQAQAPQAQAPQAQATVPAAQAVHAEQAPATPTAPAAPGPQAPEQPAGGVEEAEHHGGIGRRGALMLTAAALVVAGLIAGLVGGLALTGGSSTTVTRPAPTRPFLVMGGIPDLGVTSPRGVTSADAALAAVCAGRASAALIVTQDGTPQPCIDIVPVAHETIGARAVAIPVPPGGGGRRCVSASAIAALTASRTDAGLTALRARRVAQAARTATAAARLDALPPSEVVLAGRTAAASAGDAFDRAYRLRLLGVSAQRGSVCVLPAGRALTTGAYPLAERLSLVATSAAATSAPVTDARDAMTHAFSGPVPVSATVLR